MRIFSFFSIFFLLQNIGAGQTKYPASAIPVELQKHADAVIRRQEIRFEVVNKGEAIETEHMVVTLMNENASGLSEPYFYYYEFIEIEDIEASVYDSDGYVVRNLKKKDIKDIKPLDYFVDDFRYKVLDLPGRNYPYTIEYTVVKKHKGLMFYPDFNPQYTPSIAVEYASYQVTTPFDLKVRYLEQNMPDGSRTGPSKWELKNVPAFLPPPYSTKKSLKLAKVLAAPEAFEFGGIEGDMKTWESFGNYLNKLNETQQELPAEFKKKLQDMVRDCTDDFCKIERIYDYLQSNTRYYYVGLGIGGWQPAPASKVNQFKYGDCKGLSNYTVAMMRAVGLPANYVLIRAGKREQGTQFPEFPNAEFNHAIACVPLENETVWLECTSQTESCGFLSDFTDGRMALMVTSKGGKIMQTPVYDETVNTTERSTLIELKPDGSAKLRSVANYQGISQKIPADLEGLHDEERKKSLYENLDINDFEILSIDFKKTKGRLPSVIQQMELAMPGYASVNGKRFFLPLSPLSSKVTTPITGSSIPNFFKPDSRGFSDFDTVYIDLPIGFAIESSSGLFSIESKFGSYANEVKVEKGKLVVFRKLVLNGIERPKEDFPDFVAFLKAVAKADKTKIVLVKNSVGP